MMNQEDVTHLPQILEEGRGKGGRLCQEEGTHVSVSMVDTHVPSQFAMVDSLLIQEGWGERGRN